jgi:DNA-binding beta-propeller fold protein YncE
VLWIGAENKAEMPGYVAAGGRTPNRDARLSLHPPGRGNKTPWAVPPPPVRDGDACNHRIEKFTSGDDYLTKWGSFGSGDGQFDGPVGVATDASGNIYVADRGNNRIEKFSGSGPVPTKATSWGRLRRLYW